MRWYKQYGDRAMYYTLTMNGNEYYVVDGYYYTIDTIADIFNYIEI